MRFLIPSLVTYILFIEGSLGPKFPFGLQFVVFSGGVCVFVPILAIYGGGRKKKDFIPLTEYPTGGVLKNNYFTSGCPWPTTCSQVATDFGS